MPTVIDALVVTLGLNLDDYKKNLADLQAQDKKTKDQLQKQGRAVQDANKATAESFGLIKTEALGLFSVLIGAGSLAGFTGNTVKSMIAVSQAAQAMGAATKDVAAFGAVIQANGGDAQSAIASLTTLTGVLERFRRFGQIDPNTLGAMQKIGITDPNATALQVFQRYATWSQGKDPRDVQMEGQLLGLDQGSINEATRGGAQYATDFANALNRVVGDEKAYDNIKRLNTEFQKFGQTLKLDGAIILNDFAPALTGLLRSIEDSLSPASNKVRGEKAAVYEKAFTNAIAHGDLHGAAAAARGYAGVIFGGSPTDDSAAVATSGPSSFKSGTAEATFIVHQMRAAGISDKVIMGVLNGIAAEGGHFGEADQFDAKGNAAHGIGQWRGARWKALVARYGNHPTPAQETQFLIDELKGGDPGGAAVLGAGSSSAATRAYIQAFMRPGSGTAGDLRRAGLYGGSIDPAGGGGTTVIHVDKIEIVTKSSDAKGIARETRAVLNTRSLTGMANQGLV